MSEKKSSAQLAIALGLLAGLNVTSLKLTDSEKIQRESKKRKNKKR